MAEETIVAIYDTREHAEMAAADLRSARIADGAISLHSGTRNVANDTSIATPPTGATSRTTGIASAEPVREKGFWSSLFGGEPDHDTTVYDRSVESGSTVLTVKAPDASVEEVLEILDRHHPVDIDERASGYGLGRSSPTTGTTASSIDPMVGGARETSLTGTSATDPRSGLTGTTSARADVGEDQTLQLSAEELAVGKRLVNRGGTRIRRFVVETPVERQVSLHDERVVVERRPVTDGRPAGTVDFSDRTIEMTESSEEAVVSKTARVVEEISLHKEATDRVETVRDTVRREDVEIEQVPERGSDEPIAPTAPKKI